MRVWREIQPYVLQYHVAMLSIVLLRHGTTVENEQGVHQGRYLGGSLSDRGLLEAEAIAPLLATLRPQVILSSPMARCRETLDVVHGQSSEALSVRFATELLPGDNRLLAGRGRDRFRRDAARARVPSFRYAPPGGETAEHLGRRARAYLRQIASMARDARPIVLLTHGDWIASLVGSFSAFALPYEAGVPRGAEAVVVRMMQSGRGLAPTLEGRLPFSVFSRQEVVNGREK